MRLLKRSFQFVVRPIRPFMRNRTYRIRSGPARGLKRRGGFMFIPTPVSLEERFLNAMELEGRTVFDVGANIGIMAIYFARAVGPTGRVIAFEPNPETIPLIEDHIRLNGLSNVKIINAAVGEAPGRGRLVMHHEQRGSASMDGSTVDHFRRLGGNREFDVEVVTLDTLITDGRCPPPDFVKIDVEGFEVPCLRGMRNVLDTHRPDLFVEMHGVTTELKRTKAQQIVPFIQGFGYRIYNIQAQTLVDSPESEAALRGHLFCTTGSRPFEAVQRSGAAQLQGSR